MTDKEAIDIIRRYECNSEHFEACEMAIQALEYDDAKYHEEHGEVIVDKDVWEDAKKALENTDTLADGDRAVSLNAVKETLCSMCDEWRCNENCSKKREFDKLPSVSQRGNKDE